MHEEMIGIPQIMMGQDSEIAVVTHKGAAFPSTLLYEKEETGSVSGYKYAVDSDGRQAEIRGAPAYCREWLQDAMWGALNALHAKAKLNGLRLKASSAVRMPLANIKKGGPRCIESGCNPDFNWRGIANTSKVVFAESPWCYCGVHLHATIHRESYAWKDYPGMIHCLDTLIGIPMEAICFDKGSHLRRRFYGRAGCHRPTQYGPNDAGVEYRVIGGWALQSPALMSLAFGLMRITQGIIFTEKGFSLVNGMLPRSLVEDTINSCNREQAVSIMNNVLLPFFASYIDTSYEHKNKSGHDKYVWEEFPLMNGSKGLRMYKAALGGADLFGNTPVEENWKLGGQFAGHGITAAGWKSTANHVM